MQFLKTPRLVSVGGTRVDDQPLAIRLLEGRSGSSKGDRFLHLKHLADSTLYKLGFFADSLRRSSVDLKYYAGVGGSAYRDLSRLTGWKGDPVFGELAERFDDCVELLTTVKEGAPEHGDVVKLYELWASTGDERAEARLRSLGVMLDGPERTH
ncbi:MAG: hypothetical protein GY898_18920 [Proteobacteria bacterium]|nr:hypothetical protein [Pseudomonadota bacterium]